MDYDFEAIVERARIACTDAQRERAAELGITVAELEARQERENRAGEVLARLNAWVYRYRDQIPETVLRDVFRRRHGEGQALRLTRAWLRGDKPALILCGGTGNGKTYAALDALCAAGRGEFVRAIDLARRVDPWEHEIKQGARPMATGFRGILVVDDLGFGAEPARLHEALFRVLEARQDPQRRTLITSNLSRRDFRARYGDRIADRLNAIAAVGEVSDASFRGQGAGL